ncbi:MAG: UDP-N-acetylglucosamine 2-epimerase [Endomicrobium sp.]|nr:UDP-N-acetylglucosamine 2-epimerase [Endomicrobium sp.]
MSRKNLLIILGTRPEAIKLAPLILKLRSEKYKVTVCNTEQQRELSNQALSFFGLKADINLNVMTSDQSLFDLQSNILLESKRVLSSDNFDGVFVQGDTMSAFCGALAGFYYKVPVFHIEAGLRSGDLYEPCNKTQLTLHKRQTLYRLAQIPHQNYHLIKLAPLILKLRSEKYKVTVCNTEQQRELSNQALSFFAIFFWIKGRY